MTQPNRPWANRAWEQANPVQGLQTYRLSRPRGDQFWRKATCEQVDCPPYLHGWKVRVEGLSAQDLHVARNCGRRFVEQRIGSQETWLVFEAGQPCFAASVHQLPVEREPLYVVRGGDWRANTGLIRKHVRGEDFVDDAANNQQRIADRRAQG